jgi:hypothetical protein
MNLTVCGTFNTRWFKYDRDKLWLACTQISPGHIWTTLYLIQIVYTSFTTPARWIDVTSRNPEARSVSMSQEIHERKSGKILPSAMWRHVACCLRLQGRHFWTGSCFILLSQQTPRVTLCSHWPCYKEYNYVRVYHFYSDTLHGEYLFGLRGPRHALRYSYFLKETKKMHACEDVQLYSFIYYTDMFRSLLWPSLGCRTARMQVIC